LPLAGLPKINIALNILGSFIPYLIIIYFNLIINYFPILTILKVLYYIYSV